MIERLKARPNRAELALTAVTLAMAVVALLRGSVL